MKVNIFNNTTHTHALFHCFSHIIITKSFLHFFYFVTKCSNDSVAIFLCHSFDSIRWKHIWAFGVLSIVWVPHFQLYPFKPLIVQTMCLHLIPRLLHHSQHNPFIHFRRLLKKSVLSKFHVFSFSLTYFDKYIYRSYWHMTMHLRM